MRKLNLRSRKICKFLLTIQVRLFEQIKQIKKLSKVIQVIFTKPNSAGKAVTHLQPRIGGPRHCSGYGALVRPKVKQLPNMGQKIAWHIGHVYRK